jgi:chemotaxis protein MotB
MLLSISVVSRTKFEQMSRQLNAEAATDLMTVKERLDKAITEKSLNGQVSTALNEDGLNVEFSELVLFPTAEAKLHAQGEAVLHQFAQMLREIPAGYRLAVEGHTDSRPIHTTAYPSNWALSAARSVNVVHLLKEFGLDEKRVVVRAYSDTRPSSPDALHSKNRRVTLLIY